MLKNRQGSGGWFNAFDSTAGESILNISRSLFPRHSQRLSADLTPRPDLITQFRSISAYPRASVSERNCSTV
jgi:hypothetical protein